MKNNKKELYDPVNHPDHYQFNINGTDFEVTDIIKEALGVEGYKYFLRGNILKYHTRANRKNGKEDLRKANFYSRILEDLLNDSA